MVVALKLESSWRGLELETAEQHLDRNEYYKEKILA